MFGLCVLAYSRTYMILLDLGLPRLSTFIKSSEQLNHRLDEILSRANDILCCPNEILSCLDEILSCRVGTSSICCPNEKLSCCNNLIMLFEQNNKLCRQDIKSFEEHIKSSEQVKTLNSYVPSRVS